MMKSVFHNLYIHKSLYAKDLGSCKKSISEIARDFGDFFELIFNGAPVAFFQDTVDKTLPNHDLLEVWTEIAAVMKTEVSPYTFDRWFKEIELVELTDQDLTLLAPNNIYQFWIESNYINLLQSAIMLVLRSPRAVKFALCEKSPAEQSPAAVPETIEKEEQEKQEKSYG